MNLRILKKLSKRAAPKVTAAMKRQLAEMTADRDAFAVKVAGLSTGHQAGGEDVRR